jgi:hypothetical protein
MRDYFIYRSQQGGLLWIYSDAWAPRPRLRRSAPGTCTVFLPECASMSAMSVYALPDYAELHALSNFSFQRGASHAQELAERASNWATRRWPSPTNARWPVS